MSKPYIHAVSSAKKFGGEFNDYIEIHSFMDSSKGAVPSNIHRALTHHNWFLSTILERIKFSNSYESKPGFFPTIINSDGKHISVRDIGEQHILEDFRGKFIPTPQDFLCKIPFESWMDNGNGYPPSCSKNETHKTPKEIFYDNPIKSPKIEKPSFSDRLID